MLNSLINPQLSLLITIIGSTIAVLAAYGIIHLITSSNETKPACKGSAHAKACATSRSAKCPGCTMNTDDENEPYDKATASVPLVTCLFCGEVPHENNGYLECCGACPDATQLPASGSMNDAWNYSNEEDYSSPAVAGEMRGCPDCGENDFLALRIPLDDCGNHWQTIQVFCTSCGYHGPYGRTEGEAIAKWCYRASDKGGHND